MIRLVTDSASMIPPELRARLDVTVVPITVTVDGDEHREGVDLSTADFYGRLAGGATITTSAPSPGAIAAAFEQAAAGGADAVLSIHTGSDYSATASAASIAAGLVDIPVTVVDTGLASFPVALCVWAAADALAGGGSAADGAAAARAAATATASVFVVGVPALALRGGRFVALHGEFTPTSVLLLDHTGLSELARVDDLGAAVDMMASHTRQQAAGRRLRIGIGHAQRPSVAAELVQRLADSPGITDVILYEVGPSVAAHTGPGTVGIVYTPT